MDEWVNRWIFAYKGTNRRILVKILFITDIPCDYIYKTTVFLVLKVKSNIFVSQYTMQYVGSSFYFSLWYLPDEDDDMC